MLENALIESRTTGRARKGLRATLLSVALHAAALGTAAAMPLVLVEEPPEPSGSRGPVTFAPPRPPSAPAGPRGAAPTGQAAVRPARPSPVVQPVAVPEETPRAPAVPEAPLVAGPVVPGGLEGEGGDPAGVPGGIRSEETFHREEPEEPRRPGNGVTEPVELYREAPAYPDSALKLRAEGTVVLEAVIARSGAVESVRLLSGVNPLLDRAAMEAVSRWRYRPATFEGRPVPVLLTVTVTFRITR